MAGGETGGTILEYDITGDFIREIGNMRVARANHAVSVVQSAEFSQWCWVIVAKSEGN